MAENRAARQRRCQEVQPWSKKKYKGNLKSHETQYYTEHKVSRRVIDYTRNKESMEMQESKGALILLYLNHGGEVMTKRKSGRIETFWGVLENLILKISSTIVEVWV